MVMDALTHVKGVLNSMKHILCLKCVHCYDVSGGESSLDEHCSKIDEQKAVL